MGFPLSCLLIQTGTRFEPNEKMHKEFAQALRDAGKAGVKILAYDCLVREDGFVIDQKVPVSL